jgi:uncharacterized membrane protein YccC
MIALVVLVAVIFPLMAAQTPPVPAAPKPVPLLSHLVPPDGEWLSAYPNEPAERLAVISTIRRLIDRMGQQQREIAALTSRVAELEKRIAAMPKLGAPIDAPLPETK